jgi:hypothetical protein
VTAEEVCKFVDCLTFFVQDDHPIDLLVAKNPVWLFDAARIAFGKLRLFTAFYQARSRQIGMRQQRSPFLLVSLR